MKDTLINKIKEANEAYRNGTPFISDAEYDILLSKLESLMNFIEFEVFKQTLLEKSGTVKHEFVIGSLNKVRYGENELAKWLSKQKCKTLVISEKLDGCSFVATYKNGNLVQGASRGNGKTGTDWTEKLKHILPNRITGFNATIRGELILRGDSHTKLGYKNARNGVVGIMHEDNIVPAKLSHVCALVYDIVDSVDTAVEIFNFLYDNFTTPKWEVVSVKSANLTEEFLKEKLNLWKQESDYIMDGLVISTADYVNENVYHPERKIAFKVNSEGVKTTVKVIEWNISKGGLLKPTILVNSIDIDGSTIQRVTGFNAKYILDNQITVDTIVYICKKGDVIPGIVKVVNPK